MIETKNHKGRYFITKPTNTVKNAIWQLKYNESPFLRYFGYHVWNAYQSFVAQLPKMDDSNVMSLEEGKAFVHAYYLYDADVATDYADAYDSTEEHDKKARKLVLKALNTLRSIDYLFKVDLSEEDSESLRSFFRILTDQLNRTLRRSPRNILDSLETVKDIEHYLLKHESFFEDEFSFFEDQRSLVFLPAYRTYLTLRNAFFIRLIESLLLNEDAVDIVNDFLREESCSSISLLNYLQVETLLKLLLGTDSEYLFLEFADGFDRLAPTELPEPEEQTRSPFELLCDSYEEELEGLISHMDWVRNAFNRFLHPKITDYVTGEAEKHLRFLDGNQDLLRIFTAFIMEVAEKTKGENPYRPQHDFVGSISYEKGRQKITTRKRIRETMIIIQDKLPFKREISFKAKTQRFPRGSEFIIKFGVTYFDMDRMSAFRSRSEPVGYVQIFLHNTKIDHVNYPGANQMFVGKDVYLSLNEEQTYAWRNIVMLSLIALGQKYNMQISPELQTFLVQDLKKESNAAPANPSPS
ncbi:MAG: hypothetical protein GY866_03230 [Proteobacteria bacterium]|nr:hypothetical protein [Pseudomonadota bacterium]